MRAFRLFSAVLALCLAACAHGTPPAKEPASAPTPRGGEGLRGSAVIVERDRGLSPDDTSLLARMRRAAMARADSVAARVKSIEARPDSIVMTVGDTIVFPFPAAVTARDSSGHALEGFAPFYSIGNDNIARFRPGGVVGISEGRTTLRVDAMVRGDGRSPPRRTARTEVPLIVHGGTHGVDVPTDSVPRELVLALLGTSNPRDVAVRVGGAADDIPPAVLRDARVLGSAVSAGMSTTVAVLPYSALVAGDTVESRLLAAGWSRPKPYGIGQPGFVATFSSATPEGMLCDERAFLTYRVTQRDPWSTTVSLSYRRTPGYTPCSPRSAPAPQYLLDSPMPSLNPPANVQVQATGSGGNSNSVDARARITSGMNAGDAVKFYVGEMTDAGWELVAQAPTPDAAVATFRLTAKDGGRWFATLTALGTPQGQEVALTLHLQRLNP